MSLWLCIALPRLSLEALARAPEAADADAADAPPRVIAARQGARRWVVASAHPRIAVGEALGSVQARFADLRVQLRDLPAEREALASVGCLAYALSDRIVLIDDAPRGPYDSPFQAVGVDVAPSLKLFGGVDGLLSRVQAVFAGQPYTTRIGLAPTLDAAAVAARAGLAPIVEAPALRAALGPLPLGRLRWPLAAEEMLAASGHLSLADVLCHDAASLGARLGREFPQAIARLLGDAPDPRPWFVPPAQYRRRLDLDGEIDDWQALLFPLKRLLDEFETYLRARQVAVTQLTITLSQRRTERQAFVLRTTSASQEAAVFLRLLRERWNTQPPTAAASELRLRADHFVDRLSPQAQLFDDSHGDGEAWNALADRLRARLGDAALWRPGVADDHRPERAWSRDGQTGGAVMATPPRPLWLLRQPQRWTPRGPLAAPERIENGWWEHAPVARDYHRSRNPDGSGLWVFRDHADGRWYVHGLWD